MSKSEAIKMLAPSAISWDVTAGGKSYFNWENIAGALARMTPTAAKYASYKYLMTGSKQKLVNDIVSDRVLSIYEKHNWSAGNMRSLVIMMIDESCSSDACRRCNGTKLISTAGSYRNCITCKGTGKARFNISKRARKAGISAEAWRKTWEYRYNRHIAIIASDYEAELSKAISKEIIE